MEPAAAFSRGCSATTAAHAARVAQGVAAIKAAHDDAGALRRRAGEAEARADAAAAQLAALELLVTPHTSASRPPARPPGSV